MIKKTFGERVANIIIVFLLLCFSLAALYPMLYVLFASVSDAGLFAKHSGPLLYPTGFSLSAYEKVFAKPEKIEKNAAVKKHSDSLIFFI